MRKRWATVAVIGLLAGLALSAAARDRYSVTYSETYTVTPTKVRYTVGDDTGYDVADVVKAKFAITGTLKLDGARQITSETYVAVALRLVPTDDAGGYQFAGTLAEFASYYGDASSTDSGYVTSHRQALARQVMRLGKRDVTLTAVKFSCNAKGRTLKFSVTGTMAQDADYLTYGSAVFGPTCAAEVSETTPRLKLNGREAELALTLHDVGITIPLTLKGTAVGKTRRLTVDPLAGAEDYWGVTVGLRASAAGWVSDVLP